MPSATAGNTRALLDQRCSQLTQGSTWVLQFKGTDARALQGTHVRVLQFRGTHARALQGTNARVLQFKGTDARARRAVMPVCCSSRALMDVSCGFRALILHTLQQLATRSCATTKLGWVLADLGGCSLQVDVPRSRGLSRDFLCARWSLARMSALVVHCSLYVLQGAASAQGIVVGTGSIATCLTAPFRSGGHDHDLACNSCQLVQRSLITAFVGCWISLCL